MVRIGEIGRGSVAEALELRIGTRILTVNGERVRDSLDFMFRTAEEEIELEAVGPGGDRVVYEISRDPSESLGIVPARDKIRECANECVFCFIDGNPPGAREPLWRAREHRVSSGRRVPARETDQEVGPGLRRLPDLRGRVPIQRLPVRQDGNAHLFSLRRLARDPRAWPRRT